MDRRSWGYNGGSSSIGAGVFSNVAGYGSGGYGSGDRGGYRSEYGSSSYRAEYNDYGRGYGGGYNLYSSPDRYPKPGPGYGPPPAYGGFSGGSSRYYPLPPSTPSRMGPPQRQPQTQSHRARPDWRKRRSDYSSGKDKNASFHEKKRRTVFVRNCPEKPEEEITNELKKLFDDSGKVERVAFFKQELIAANGAEKKSVVEVRVLMSSEEESKKALEKNGTVFDDRHLVISRQEVDFDAWKTTVVCCLNISLDVDEEDMWRFFESCGTIKNIKRMNATNGDGQLYGQIHFATEEEAQKAMALDGQELKGQPLKLRMWASIKDHPGLGVVVLNLPFEIKRKEALAFMEGTGDIFSLKIDAADATTKRAVFVFWDEACVENALKLDGKEMNKQLVRVLRWDGQRLLNPIFISNLNSAVSEADLWKIFQVCGYIENIHKERVKFQNQNNENNVKAYIEFLDADSVSKALAFNDMTIRGVKCKISTDKEEWDNIGSSARNKQNGQAVPNEQQAKPADQSESCSADKEKTDETEKTSQPENVESSSESGIKQETVEEPSSAEPQLPAKVEKEETEEDAAVKEEPDSIAQGRTPRKRRAVANHLTSPPKTRRGR